MLSNTLIDIKTLLNFKLTLSEDTIKKLVKLLTSYKLGSWIYPGVLKRKLEISTKDSYAILQTLEKEGYLSSFYELYCSNCQKSSGIVIETFNEIPDTFECEVCHIELPSLENAAIIYKVVKE